MKPNLVLRIVGPVLAISALPLVVGIASAWQIHTSQRRVSQALANDVVGVRSGESLAIGIRDTRTELNQYLITGDPRHLQAVATLRPEMAGWLDEARRAAETPREEELIARLRWGYESFFAELDRLTHGTLSAEARAEGIRQLISGTLTAEMLAPAQEFLDTNETEIVRSNADNQAMSQRAVLGLLLLGICGPLSGLVAGIGIARGFSRSIVRLSLPIQDAAGKLNELVGPITFSARAGLDEIELVLHRIAAEIGSVMQHLEDSRREALRAEQLASVGQMAAGIAHELRNPLMAMKILVQAAAEASPPVLGERDLCVLENEITRLERSTERFLDFARPAELERRTFDLRALIGDVLALVTAQAERRGVSLRCDAPENRAIPIKADRGQIRQVLLNLLLNALDAVSEGGTVWIELETLEPRDGTGDWLTLRVCDTGPGLPNELGPRIFEPFVGTKASGIGLGLSICKRIVESHGGQIEAADRPAGGAVFLIRLPMIDEAVPRTSTVAAGTT